MNEAVELVSRPSETTELHTRLLKCSIAIEESRAYWSHIAALGDRPAVDVAFHEYWFGARSQAWVKLLLDNFQARFDAFPGTVAVLAGWNDMLPEVRQLICHWHLQLSDPLYRAFTGVYLVQRRDALRPQVYRQDVIGWLKELAAGRWTIATLMQFSTRLLSCAFAAGLVKGKRDPRELAYPRVPDEALGYLLYRLRGVDFEGSLARNPYLASVGLQGGLLADRLRTLGCVTYHCAGDTDSFEWRYADLESWAAAEAHQGVA